MTQSTYNIVASDGQTYGPNSHETIQSWIAEGRIARETQMSRSDVEGWFKAGDFQEFTWPAGAAPAAAAAAPVAAAASPTYSSGGGGGRLTLKDMDPNLVAEMRHHANWFYWIAAFSIFYSFYDAMGGLAIGIVAGIFTALIGYFAGRAHIWAFILGLLLLVLHLIAFAMDQRWLAVAVRVWAIIEVFRGMQIARALRKRMREG